MTEAEIHAQIEATLRAHDAAHADDQRNADTDRSTQAILHRLCGRSWEDCMAHGGQLAVLAEQVDSATTAYHFHEGNDGKPLNVQEFSEAFANAYVSEDSQGNSRGNIQRMSDEADDSPNIAAAKRIEQANYGTDEGEEVGQTFSEIYEEVVSSGRIGDDGTGETGGQPPQDMLAEGAGGAG